MAPRTDILIIGTEPPCPRCDLLRRRVSRIVAGAPRVTVRHGAFDAPEARDLARRWGRRIGTAKDVARDAGVTVDWSAVHEVIERRRLTAPSSEPADAWSPALDELLEPCRRVAESAGYVMTPVLVVDGRVCHHGHVPPPAMLRRLLSRAIPGAPPAPDPSCAGPEPGA